jgi:hypothetical protein
MSDLIFNGLFADSGAYAYPPMSAADLAAIAADAAQSGELSDKKVLKSLRQRKSLDSRGADFGPIEGIDPKDLAQSGWGVIFAHDADPAIVDALRPLLDLRKSQAQKIKEGRYRELTGDQGFFPGDTKFSFLDNHGAGGGGAADPDQLPYYLLIVGSPEVIPWSFQYQLDVQYAVGRLWFDDNSPDSYARYAQSVVQAENGGIALPRRAAFFGPSSEDDAATELSASQLIAPLSRQIQDGQHGWNIKAIAPQEATKARLAELFGGGQTPAVLFTATHGMLYRAGDPRQFARMGALVCADWPGPSFTGPVPDSFCFAGDDIASDACLSGLISFHFACFGAGTPQCDDFRQAGAAAPRTIAPKPFAGRLPQRLLAHPKGGALAVIGHVDRAWGYSFQSKKGDTQLRTFHDALKRLMEGHPVGSAMEPFNQRYAELSSDLSNAIFTRPDDLEMAFMWTCNNDARNYVVMGDPAVRLRLADDPSQVKRETIMPIEVAPTPPPTPQLAAKLQEMLDSLSTVEVSTYASKTGKMEGAALRVYTRVGLDGKTELCLPEGQVDEALCKIHSEMVRNALDHRVAMLNAIASALANLKTP